MDASGLMLWQQSGDKGNSWNSASVSVSSASFRSSPSGNWHQERRCIDDGRCCSIPSPPPSPPRFDRVPLAQFAPTDDAAIGVLPSTGEVYFKPVPNDGSLSNTGNGHGASAFPVQVVAPAPGDYEIDLEDRQGSHVFKHQSNRSLCHSTKSHQSASTDSLLLCTADPRSGGSNPDGSPDISSCQTFSCCGNRKTFTLTTGVNTLLSRESVHS